MKKIVVAVSLVYLVTVVAGFPTEVPESEKCVPNTTFTHDDGCNSCFCRESGLKKLAGCTRMSCAPLHARGSRKHRSVDEDFKFDHSTSSSSSYSKSHSVSWSSSHGGSSSSSFSHSSSSSHGGSAVASSSSRAVAGGGSQAGSSSKSVSVSTDTCLPGSSFLHSDNCNTCTCPESGIRSQAGCTLKLCPNVTPQDHTHHSSESTESSEHHTNRDTSQTCEPGTSFMDSNNCNSCLCPPTGLKSQAGCTRKFCFNTTLPVSTDTCLPGSSFLHSDNCNTCTCPESGLKSQAACTEKLCINVTPQGDTHHSSESSGPSVERLGRDTSQTCEPGTSFMDSENCNSCLCPTSGLKSQAGCTMKLCINTTLPVSTDTCLPGSSFLHSDNCNTCTCPESGIRSQAGCTLKLCPNVTPQGHTHHSSESSESSEHRTARDTSQTCEPGTSFMDAQNCNSCFCPPSGLKSQAGCTLKYCFNTTLPVTTVHLSSESSAESSEHVTAKRDTSQTCEPGTSFMDAEKCNTCLCPPSGLKLQAACTLKSCHNTTLPVTTVHHSSESSAESSEHTAAKRDTSQTCEPGTSFMDSENCNRCLCPPSGLKSQAGCTIKLCYNTTLPVSTDTCLPGSSFLHSDNCNTCTCPDSGVKSQAACTEKLCINVTPQGHTHHSSESSESSEHRTTRDTSRTCEPGTSFMDAENCNSCLCPPSGLKSQAGCTEKLCINTTLPVTTVHHSSESSADTSEHVAAKRETSGESSEETCAEGDKWIAADGCNHCWCPNSRKKSEAACTRMACLPPHLIPSKDY